ncbi:NAD-dependent epimerase/dehydratase family protein [Ochrobactrum sp. BTU1]|uniref:NAD-dependent epimerase/dehydratase family protein n=1 Tax=Ochrobactrum sp. BTU1 TaxID=2840456 RepID=UPI001C05DD57|nr:NAD-dependent epimerase/dehydratase family protein [Ochrobactrum sp. BTU1]
MNLEGKNIAIVGGAGLVGSHTLEAILKEDVAKVLIIDNFKRGKMKNIVHALEDSRVHLLDTPTDILRTDVLTDTLKDVDAIVHLASMWLTFSQLFPRSAVEENVIGGFNVIEVACRLGIKKVVFASSASVYGDAVQKPMKEEHPLNNTTVYGATKICLEHLAMAMHHLYETQIVGLRYFNIYGPRQDSRGAYNSVIVKFLDSAENDRPLTVFGDGQQSYDFISVKDTARANVCALKSETPFGIFNVCTGRATSILDLAKCIMSATQSKSSIHRLPEAPSFVTDRVGCPEAARHSIDFSATVPLEAGIAEFAKWRRDHNGIPENVSVLHGEKAGRIQRA